MLRNRWLRILGVAFVMYVLSYIDRVNIAMAAPAIRAELGLSPAAMGLAAGFFPWGYVVLQIPAGRLAGVWSAKRVILIQLVLWSAVALSTAFVDSAAELVLNRFCAGARRGRRIDLHDRPDPRLVHPRRAGARPIPSSC